VRSLALVVTHPGGLRHALPPLTSLLLFLGGFLGPRRLRSRALERLIFPDDYLQTVDAGRLRSALREHVVTAAPARQRLAQLAAVLGHRAGPRLSALADIPTLVVKARRDRLVRPSAADQLHARIPGSSLVEFEDAGHAILHQCADRLNRTLLAHFAGVDSVLPPTSWKPALR
jgi:pimeloyl-ACP methyl ester carboxylesterase